MNYTVNIKFDEIDCILKYILKFGNVSKFKQLIIIFRYIQS